MVELPYGTGEHFGAVILVPEKSENLDQLVALSPSKWGGWIQQMRKQKASLLMPRFKVDYGVRDLKVCWQKPRL